MTDFICETLDAGNSYRKEYILSIENLITKKQAEAEQKRESRASYILNEQEKAREELKNMFGWPLSEKPNDIINVKSVYIGTTEYGAEAYRMQFEILPDFLYYGILFLHKDQVRPLSVSQHGGLGTPELCSGLHGNSANYNDITKRLFTRGFHVFAPQDLLWSLDNYPIVGTVSYPNIDAMRRTCDRKLKELGGSIAALELYCLFRVFDYFEKEKYVQKEGFAMAGLSYGGSYTSFAAALEPRIKSAVSCSFFNRRDIYDWQDWTWTNSANLFYDAEMALLTYPRHITYQIGTRDELFNVRTGKEEYERAVRMAPKDFSECVKLEVFEGNHEFSRNDDALDRMAADFNL